MIDSVGLVHMNGRVYDPTLGRFLSADPNVQALDNLQNFNRYSYVLNNPLSYTDPTGFFFSKLFKAIGQAFGKLFQAIGRALKKLLRSPIVRAIIQIVGCSFGPVACAATSGAMTAVAGGSMADIFQAVAFSFISTGVWKAVGAIKGLTQIGRVLVHGIVNGALTVARGGNFLAGFAAGALGKLGGLIGQNIFGPYGSENGVLGRAFVSGIAGCAGAVLSGGKCVNGAISAAFASMYNGDGKVTRKLSIGFGSKGQSIAFEIEAFNENYLDIGEEALRDVFGTNWGQFLLRVKYDQYLNPPHPIYKYKDPVFVSLTRTDGKADGSFEGNSMSIDMSLLSKNIVNVVGSDEPIAPTLTRLIGHESGHTFTGLTDNILRWSLFGWEFSTRGMQNVIVNENSIMRELGQPARTSYP